MIPPTLLTWSANTHVPVLILSPVGDLLFYNTPAGNHLGQAFLANPRLSALEWATHFQPINETGLPFLLSERPAAVALTEHRAAVARGKVRNLDGELFHVDVFATPIHDDNQNEVGVLVVFWDIPS